MLYWSLARRNNSIRDIINVRNIFRTWLLKITFWAAITVSKFFSRCFQTASSDDFATNCTFLQSFCIIFIFVFYTQSSLHNSDVPLKQIIYWNRRVTGHELWVKCEKENRKIAENLYSIGKELDCAITNMSLFYLVYSCATVLWAFILWDLWS